MFIYVYEYMKMVVVSRPDLLKNILLKLIFCTKYRYSHYLLHFFFYVKYK